MAIISMDYLPPCQCSPFYNGYGDTSVYLSTANPVQVVITCMFSFCPLHICPPVPAVIWMYIAITAMGTEQTALDTSHRTKFLKLILRINLPLLKGYNNT